MTDWQLIETAPKDGTKILAYASDGPNNRPTMRITWWRSLKDDAGYIGWGEFNMHYWPPTHWQPLPEPPAKAADTRLADAVRKARGGDAPTPKRSFA